MAASAVASGLTHGGTGHVEYGVLPAPWAAEFDPAQGWTPVDYDPKRATKMVAEDLCQLCGRLRGDEVYVLAGNPDSEQAVMSGGALSALCARLTAAICPRFRNQWPVRVLAVNHLGLRQRVTALDRDLDDRVNLASSSARLISTVDRPPRHMARPRWAHAVIRTFRRLLSEQADR